MSTHEQTRRAHDLLDDISSGYQPREDELHHLRSFLPERPKQKTLEEITKHVYDAWIAVSGNEWYGNSYNMEISLEDWLEELYTQLNGVKDTPADVPALPAGMRLADHEEIGRVVASPATDSNGERMIFCLEKTSFTGAGRRWAHEASLTFFDPEPAKPAHPEFLETEADYESAPQGTIVSEDNHYPAWKPTEHWFINNNPFDNREMAGGLRPAPSRVLRWGWGE